MFGGTSSAEARLRRLEYRVGRLAARRPEDRIGPLEQSRAQQTPQSLARGTPAAGNKVLIWTGGAHPSLATSEVNSTAAVWAAQGETVDVLASGTPTLADYRLIWIPCPVSLSIASAVDAWLDTPGRRLILDGEAVTAFSSANTFVNSLLGSWGFTFSLTSTNVVPSGTTPASYPAVADPLTAGVSSIWAIFGVGTSGGTPLATATGGAPWLAHQTRAGGAQVVLSGDFNFLVNHPASPNNFNYATANAVLIRNLYSV